MLREVRKIIDDLATLYYVSVIIRRWKNVNFYERLWQCIIINNACRYNGNIFKYFYASIMNLPNYIIMMNLL